MVKLAVPPHLPPGWALLSLLDAKTTGTDGLSNLSYKVGPHVLGDMLIRKIATETLGRRSICCHFIFNETRDCPNIRDAKLQFPDFVFQPGVGRLTRHIEFPLSRTAYLNQYRYASSHGQTKSIKEWTGDAYETS